MRAIEARMVLSPGEWTRSVSTSDHHFEKTYTTGFDGRELSVIQTTTYSIILNAGFRDHIAIAVDGKNVEGGMGDGENAWYKRAVAPVDKYLLQKREDEAEARISEATTSALAALRGGG